jgi:hypothetical protein
MKSMVLIAALAGLGSPALAQHGGGLGGGVGGGIGAGVGAGLGAGMGGSMGGGMGGMSHQTGVGSTIGADHGTLHSDMGVSTRTDARVNSQGPAHAADRALERANANSVLSGSSRTTASLTGLRTGLTVRDSSGATVGTISRINRSAKGTVRNVLVKTASGKRKVVALAPDTLTVNGDVVTTTRLATSSGRR